MWMLMMEAGVAMFLLVFIVWWTMFAGRKPEHPVARRRDPESGERTPPARTADDASDKDTTGN